MAEILKNPRANAPSSTVKDYSRSITKSHYGSIGPEFYRILFNLGGQSPLISYYLKKRDIADISKASKQAKIKLTEILKEPTPPAPTYRDIIKEAKRQFAKRQKDFRLEMQRTNEEIKRIKEHHQRIDKEIDRLQKKATKKPSEVKKDFEKFLHTLRIDAKMEKEFMTSSSSSSTEDCTLEEEHCIQE